MKYVILRRFLPCLSLTYLLLAYPGVATAQETEEQAPVAGDSSSVSDILKELSDLRNLVKEMAERERAANERATDLEARLAQLEASQVHKITNPEAAELRGAYAIPSRPMIPEYPGYSYFGDNSFDNFNLADSRPEGSEDVGTEGEPEVRKSPAQSEAVSEAQKQNQGRFGDRISLEMAFGYSHFDNARLNLSGFLALDAIFLGTISIDEVNADIFTVDPTLRFGLSDRLVVDANVPYLIRTSNFKSGGAGGSAGGLVEKTVHDDGIGDINFGASYRVIKETLGRPDIVLNARVKLPTGRHPYGVELVEVENSEGNLNVPVRLSTGSGVWGASVGLSALKTLDPMVVFGSVSYFRNFAKSFGDIDEAPEDQPGRVNVGDAWQFGAGLAYALNDTSSISMSYSQRIVQRTKVQREGQDFQDIVGSQANVAMLNLGATFAINKRMSLIATVGVGMTDDSPDMDIGIRIPFRF